MWSKRWAALLIGLIGILSTGRTLAKAMLASSSLAWRLAPRVRTPLKVVGGLIGLAATMGLLVAVRAYGATDPAGHVTPAAGAQPAAVAG